MRFKARRCATLPDVQAWVVAEYKLQHTDNHGLAQTSADMKKLARSVSVPVRPCPSLPPAALVANAALSLLNLACHLLDRQLASQAWNFLDEGGVTERLYRLRSEKRRGGP